MSVLKARELGLAIVLTALALIIPLVFTFLRIVIGPFTATLASHVPSMIAMFISPPVAVLVGLGSTFGFLINLGPVVAARAFIHVIFGYAGAKLYARGMSPWMVMVAVLPIHALGEALVVIPFGYSLYDAGFIVGVGTALHHMMDAAITLSLAISLTRMGLFSLDRAPAAGRRAA